MCKTVTVSATIAAHGYTAYTVYSNFSIPGRVNLL